jgi:hypothetical protein
MGENPERYAPLNHESQAGRRSYTFALLLKTCRQIHAEARLLPFQLNTFELGDPFLFEDDFDSCYP